MVREKTIAVHSAQLLQRLIFDLADAFAADLKLLTDFGERVLMTLAQAEAELENQPLAGRQGVEGGGDVALEHRFAGGFVWSFGYIVGDQVAKTGVILIPDGVSSEIVRCAAWTIW